MKQLDSFSRLEPRHRSGPHSLRGQFPPMIWTARFLEDDPNLGERNAAWLVGHDEGIAVLNGTGQRTRDLPVDPGPVQALAVRPRGSLPANTRSVVFSQPIPNPELIQRPGGCHQIWCLGPSGKVSLLAGAPKGEALAAPQAPRAAQAQGMGAGTPALLADPPQRHRTRDTAGMTPFRDGPAHQAMFGHIAGLEMGRDGTVYVADSFNRLIRKVTPDGQVSTLAGQIPGP